jgi:hypothetical protein
MVLLLVNAKGETEYNSSAWCVIRFATRQPVISAVSDQTAAIKGDSTISCRRSGVHAGFHYSFFFFADNPSSGVFTHLYVAL